MSDSFPDPRSDDELDLFDLGSEQARGEDAPAPDGVDAALRAVARAAGAVEEELLARGVDLDEDLFDFGPVPGVELDPLADAAHEVEEVLAGLDLDSTGLDLGFLDEPEDQPALAPAGEAAPRAAAGPQSDPAPDAQPAESAADLSQRALPAPPPLLPSPAQRRPLWIAAAALVLANVALVALAWRASRDLRGDLDLVRGDLAATARDLRQSMRAPEHEVAAAAPRAESDPAGTAARVPALPGPGGLALAVAREELDGGLHAAARRRLARLLATVDSLPSDERAEIEARASFLLAESWTREAAARGETRP